MNRAPHPLRDRVVFPAMLAALAGIAGCGEQGPKAHPVKGQVEIKGGKGSQLAGGFVEFQSTADEKVRPRGQIEEDGSFALATFVEGKSVEGAVPGTYRARVMPPSEVDSGDRPDGAIDRRFRDFRTSGLTFTVTEGDNRITVPVERPRR